MIYYSDGVFPWWGFIIMFIVFYALRKEYKINKEFEKSMEKQKKEKEIQQETINISIDNKKDELLKDYLNSYNYKKATL